MQEALSDAQSIAVGNDNNRIAPAHLAQALLQQQGGAVSTILSQMGADKDALERGLGQLIGDLPKIRNNNGDIQLSLDLGRILNLADKHTQKKLREIDKRIRYLTKRLDNLHIVDRYPDNKETVYFGAWVRLESEDGEIKNIRIVGSDEFDPKKGWISIESPMAKNLIGKQLGAQISLDLPSKRIDYEILDIRYEPITK